MRTPANQPIESHIRRESPTGNPLTKFVNLCQTPEERRDKYNYCRFFGLDYIHATRMRDWHWPKINAYIYYFSHPEQLPLITIAPGG